MKWYAIYGSNGLGVYDDWGRAEKALKYLKKCNTKSFKTKSDATAYAIEMYNDLAGDDFKGPVPINYSLNMEYIMLIKHSDLSPTDDIGVEWDKEDHRYRIYYYRDSDKVYLEK